MIDGLSLTFEDLQLKSLGKNLKDVALANGSKVLTGA